MKRLDLELKFNKYAVIYIPIKMRSATPTVKCLEMKLLLFQMNIIISHINKESVF